MKTSVLIALYNLLIEISSEVIAELPHGWKGITENGFAPSIWTYDETKKFLDENLFAQGLSKLGGWVLGFVLGWDNLPYYNSAFYC